MYLFLGLPASLSTDEEDEDGESGDRTRGDFELSLTPVLFGRFLRLGESEAGREGERLGEERDKGEGESARFLRENRLEGESIPL